MKKIIIALTIVFATLGLNAQTPVATKETKKQKKEKVTQTQTTTSNGLKKDGTPDMRLKANKTKVQTTTQATVAPQPKPSVNTQPAPTVQTQLTPHKRTRTQVQTQPQVQPQVQQQRTQVSTTTTKSVDQVVETDAKGRTIYQGPRGGKYYIDKNGHKEYIKQ